MQLVQTITVATTTARIEFQNIPQTGRDLLCLFSIRTQQNDTAPSLYLSFNSDGLGSNYLWRRLYGDGSTAYSGNASNQNLLALVNGGAATANVFGNGSLSVPSYTANSSKAWSIDAVTENNDSLAFQTLMAGQYTPTSPVTRLTLDFLNNLTQGSSASLYIIS